MREHASDALLNTSTTWTFASLAHCRNQVSRLHASSIYRWKIVSPVRVFYENRPLAGALVKLTNLKDDATPFEVHLTGEDGRASFAMPTSGAWLLNVIWTKALPRTDEADFETVFSSLSFGFSSDRS